MTKIGATPGSQTSRPGFVEKPITPVLPGSPVPEGPTRRQRWILIAAAALLVVIGGVVTLAWPRDDDSPAATIPGESATGLFGGAPGAGTTGSAPSGAQTTPGGSAGADASAGASPGLSATPSPSSSLGPTARSGSFEVSSRVTVGLLGSSAEITIRNTGTAVAVWHSVMVKTNGSGVASSDPSVSYSPQGGEHCFVPHDGTLAAGASFVFTVTVSGVLPNVTDSPLDTPPCPA